jgi:hypothetical protein
MMQKMIFWRKFLKKYFWIYQTKIEPKTLREALNTPILLNLIKNFQINLHNCGVNFNLYQCYANFFRPRITYLGVITWLSLTVMLNIFWLRIICDPPNLLWEVLIYIIISLISLTARLWDCSLARHLTWPNATPTLKSVSLEPVSPEKCLVAKLPN